MPRLWPGAKVCDVTETPRSSTTNSPAATPPGAGAGLLLFPGDDPWPEIAFVRELGVAYNRYVAAEDSFSVGYATPPAGPDATPFSSDPLRIGVSPDFHQQHGIPVAACRTGLL